MELKLNLRIDRPADEVWRVLATEFDDIHQWLDAVVDSYAMPEVETPQGWPSAGRVCQLSQDPSGLHAWERITKLDAAMWLLEIEVEVRNAPALMPIKSNTAVFQLRELGDGATEVSLTASPQLKAHGYAMYPLLKLGLTKNFAGLLDALKAQVESRTAQAAWIPTHERTSPMPLYLLLAASLAAAAPSPAAEPPPVPAAAQDLPLGLHIHLEEEVAASADESWSMLAHDYVDVADWTGTVVKSWEMTDADVPAGMAAHADAPVIGRMVKSKLGVISETLVAYDDAGRTFTFRAGGLPAVLAYSQNTQHVIELPDGRSKITWDIYVVPNGPPMLRKKIEKRFTRNLGRVLLEARDRIEADATR